MGEFKIGRAYHEALRRLGVKNPEEVTVGVPLQLGVQVDSLGHLKSPVPVAIAATGQYQAAAAGQRGVPIEWHIRSPGGAWVLGCTSFTGELCLTTLTTTIIDVAPAVIAPQIDTSPNLLTAGVAGTTPALASIARTGHTTLGGAAGTLGWTLDVGALISIPFWVPMGTFVALRGRDLNQNNGGSIMIQEVPTAGSE